MLSLRELDRNPLSSGDTLDTRRPYLFSLRRSPRGMAPTEKNVLYGGIVRRSFLCDRLVGEQRARACAANGGRQVPRRANRDCRTNRQYHER